MKASGAGVPACTWRRGGLATAACVAAGVVIGVGAFLLAGFARGIREDGEDSAVKGAATEPSQAAPAGLTTQAPPEGRAATERPSDPPGEAGPVEATTRAPPEEDTAVRAAPSPGEGRGLVLEGVTAERARSLRWYVIDDQVMGGRSQSAVATTDEGWLAFAGTINTNGGGFCRCRTAGDSEPLGIPRGAEAIEVTAEGDGRQYTLTLHAKGSWASWEHDFRPEPGAVGTFALPLRSFKASWRGRVVPGTLTPSDVTAVGVGHSLNDMYGGPNLHFGDGPFKITVRGLKVV